MHLFSIDFPVQQQPCMFQSVFGALTKCFWLLQQNTSFSTPKRARSNGIRSCLDSELCSKPGGSTPLIPVIFNCCLPVLLQFLTSCSRWFCLPKVSVRQKDLVCFLSSACCVLPDPPCEPCVSYGLIKCLN